MATANAPEMPALLWSLQRLQAHYSLPVRDVEVEAPAAALSSLRDAAKAAPQTYADYLEEAVECYERGLYRAAILMVWAATVEHLYGVAGANRQRVTDFEKENKTRFGQGRNYREIKKLDDFRYLGEAQFLQLAEDVGLINRNARAVLTERLNLRNLCGHPTRYRPGREETVIFIESLVLNVLSGTWLNWSDS